MITINAEKKAAIDAERDKSAGENFDGLESRRADVLANGSPEEKLEAVILELDALKRKIGVD